MKTCSRCHIEKPLSEFSFVKSRGHYRSHCKACRVEEDRDWKRRNPQKAKAKNRRWGAIRNATRQAARKAQHHVETLKKTCLQSGFCEICGQAAEAHHEDYSKPSKVTWLCRKHHMERHRDMAAHGLIP